MSNFWEVLLKKNNNSAILSASRISEGPSFAVGELTSTGNDAERVPLIVYVDGVVEHLCIS